MGKTNKLFLAVGLMALVVLVGAGCNRNGNKTDDTDTATDSQTTTDETGFGDAVNSDTNSSTGLPDSATSKARLVKEAQDATTAIKSLKEDVVLQLVSMKFINSLSDTTGLSTNYFIYSSPADPDFYYLVNAPRNGESKKRFLMPKEDLDLNFDLIPVPFDQWNKSYIEALNAVENQGGSAFRTAHKDFEVSVILASPAGGSLSWFISYKANDSTGQVFQASVDAKSGTVSIVQ